MTGSSRISRRQFVSLVSAVLGTFIGALISLPAIHYLLSPALKIRKSEAWIPLGSLETYPIGTPTLFSFTRTKVNGWEKTVNSYGVYVLRQTSDKVVVLSNMCTHLSCRVSWKEDVKEYICPCHDGHFNIDGMVTYGPPPRPLASFTSKVEDGNLFVFLQEA